jgi:hypothetical protein
MEALPPSAKQSTSVLQCDVHWLFSQLKREPSQVQSSTYC